MTMYPPFYPSGFDMEGIQNALRRVNPKIIKTSEDKAAIALLEACWFCSYPDYPAPCSEETFEKAYTRVFALGKGMPSGHQMGGGEVISIIVGAAMFLLVIVTIISILWL